MMPESLFEQVVIGFFAVLLLPIAVVFFTMVVRLIADAIIEQVGIVKAWLAKRREAQRQERISDDAMREADKKQLYAAVRQLVEDDQRRQVELANRLAGRS